MSPPPSIAATAADAGSCAPAAPSVEVVPAPVADRTLGAIGFIVASTMFFTLSDVAAKMMTDGVHPIEITWFRFVVFTLTIPVAVLIMRGPRALTTRRPLMQLARGASLTAASTCFILGLGSLPMAENTAIAFLGPVFITALSIPLLGETVGVRRWAATLAGFLGVMLIVRPGTDAFQLAAILPMGAAVLAALGSIVTRVMAGEAPETTLSWTALTGLLMMSLAVPFVWTTPTLWEIMLGITTGVFSTIGQIFVVLAFRSAAASILAPFSYVQLLFAGVLSYLAFQEIPSLWTFAGGAVIAASGLYTAHRERVRAREKSAVAVGVPAEA